MASRCIHCNGELRYDIAKAKVKCIHCDSLYEPEEFHIETAAEEYADPTVEQAELASGYEATIFVCSNCGAEVYSTELDAVNYCMYCGSFVTLESNLARVRKPSLIMPFTKTMEECKAAYSSFVRWKLYAPSEFRDASFINGFKGIYIPFWNYEYSYGPNIVIRGSTESRKGDYVYTQHYKTSCRAEGTISNVAYDASSTFDDEISLRIAPYDREKMKKFNPAYMFGFFGDTADIKKSVYSQESTDTVVESLWDSFTGNSEVEEGHPEDEKPKSLEKDFNLKKKASLALLPVWFLTWRKGDRIAYSVVNGDTGKVYAEVPIDMGRYLLFSLLTAIPIFFALNTSVTFSASEMLWWAMLLALFMIMLYVFELDKIVRRVMHTDDRGFLEKHEAMKEASDSKVTANLISELLDALGSLSALEWILGIVAVIGITLAQTAAVAIGVIVMVLGLPCYVLWRLWDNIKILKDYTILMDVAGAIFSVFLSVGTLIYDPAPDIYYYATAMVCMLGVGLAAMGMVRRYNYLITRPVPRFFDRRVGA